MQGHAISCSFTWSAYLVGALGCTAVPKTYYECVYNLAARCTYDTYVPVVYSLVFLQDGHSLPARRACMYRLCLRGTAVDIESSLPTITELWASAFRSTSSSSRIFGGVVPRKGGAVSAYRPRRLLLQLLLSCSGIVALPLILLRTAMRLGRGVDCR